jgi:hypothetical protein
MYPGDLGLALDDLELLAVVLGQLVLLPGEVVVRDVLAEGGVDVVYRAALAEGLPSAQEHLLEAPIVYHLQLASLLLRQLRVEGLVERGRADVPIGFYVGGAVLLSLVCTRVV